MNRRNFMAIVAAVVGQSLALPAMANKQKFPKRSLCVNVNEASLEELISLPEIGPELAKEIFANRRYKQVKDLLQVPGIGEKTLEIIRPYVRFEGKTEPCAPK